MSASPICIFAYSRLQHTRELVDSLRANPEAATSELTVFIDAPKNASAAQAVRSVIDYAQTITGFARVTIIPRKENLGLAKSIISGVTQMLESSETIIVLEDDLVVSPYFLKYMNDGLRQFASESRVASIHGYVYPLLTPPKDCFFIRGADCWGWATWRRAWRVFNSNGSELLSQLESRGLTRQFDFNGSHEYTQMLRDQISGKNQSWAIRWNASAFLADMLTLYPSRSLVENRGFDGTGEHCSPSTDFNVTLSEANVEIGEIHIVANAWGTCEFARYFNHVKPSIFRRFISKVKHLTFK